MNAKFRTFLKSRRGNAGTEFAFILPIMLLFIGGIVEFGRFFIAYNEVNRLATRYAITYADCVDSPTGTLSPCNIELQTIYSKPIAMQNLAPQLSTTSPPTLRMFQVTMSSASPPTATVNYYIPASPTLSASELTVAQNTIGSSQSSVVTGVVVTLTYTHQLLFFSKIMSSFLPASLLTVTYTVAQRK